MATCEKGSVMTTTPDTEIGAALVPRRHRFTADEYQQMGRAGVPGEDARTELLDGEIYDMAAIDNWHNGTVDFTNGLLVVRLSGRAIVRVQGSFRLSSFSEPQPDILVLRPRTDYYRDSRVGPADVLLLIEVSDSTHSHDRNVKLPLYAADGIREVWIVSRKDRRIQVYRDPKEREYGTVSYASADDVVSPLAFPDVVLRTGDITG